MRISADIIKALNSRLLTVDGGSYSGKIRWENAKFVPPEGEIWLRQDTLFAEPALVGAFVEAGHYREQGIYQITVMYPEGDGAVEASQVADIIQSHFIRGSILTSNGVNVKVEKTYRSSARKESPWLTIPVSVVFWAYTAYGS